MDGDPMTALGGHPIMQGQRYTYQFVAHYAGTYYHCHVSATEHIQMGMEGALIIRLRGQPNRAYAKYPTLITEAE
jgi:FtsP/CotA-like multicopper oxidase with cupredoxin domain